MTVLVDNLWFANGVALSPNEDFLLVSDLVRSKILKVWLTEAKFGEAETFIEGLPGYPDNLSADKNGIWVAMPVTADPDHPSLFQSMAPMPLTRKFLARLYSLAELLFVTIDKVYPNEFCKNTIHKLVVTGMTSILNPERSTVLRIDWNGNILAAYHSYDGNFYTHAMELDGHLYLGSFTNDYIGKVVKRAHL